MPDFPTPIEITSLASLLAPGLIISTIRIRAVTGSAPDFKDRVLQYGLISSGYFAAITPLFHVAGGVPLAPWLWNFSQYFALPVLIGIASAYTYQFRLSYRLAGLVKLHLAHHLPASWDYAFEARTRSSYLLVTLQDGSQVAGRWAEGSFASSSSEERDILISEVWNIDDQGTWTPVAPTRSILISAKEIRYIEFIGA